MAQLGSAQREPSMEEILASIRRIIEDSDSVRRGDDPVVRPDNDIAAPQGLAETAPVANQASVIAVEAFRSAPRGEAGIFPEVRETFTMADVQAQVMADRAAAREVAERPSEAAEFEAATFDEASTAAEIEPPAAADGGPSADSVDAWRLGISEPETVEAASEADFDMDDVANAVLRDIASAQTPSAEADHPAAEIDEPDEAPDFSVELARPAIISDQTERQVAAAFSELSEALAARNRKSLDEMAEEMLRPMLQDWLDNNLPALVERLVREEIERIARGA
jgi:cell pole-organizing protein PopZ